MTIHREGHSILFILLLVLFGLNWLVFSFYPQSVLIQNSAILVSVLFYLLILQFFRNPLFEITQNTKHVLAPADGKVVVIEEAEETEYIKGRRKQISIFMSPLNVHINWYPNQGNVIYEKYHKGKYLVAWNPKSSTENERTTVVQQLAGGKVLMRQVAGALARRIVCYAKTQSSVKGGDEMGFIKFGSRVDIYLPVDAKIHVSLEERVTGCQTRIATL